MSRQAVLASLVAVIIVLLAVSGWQPFDRATWWMEVAPVLIALPLLVLTRNRFPLTPLLYGLIFVHATILIGAYRRPPTR